MKFFLQRGEERKRKREGEKERKKKVDRVARPI